MITSGSFSVSKNRPPRVLFPPSFILEISFLSITSGAILYAFGRDDVTFSIETHSAADF